MSKPTISPLRAIENSLTLPLAERTWLLHLSDILAINLSLVVYILLHPQYRLSWALIKRRPFWFITLTVLWLLMAHAFEAYAPRTTGHLRSSALAVMRASAMTSALYLLIPYLTPMLPVHRSLLLVLFMAMMVFPTVGRVLHTAVFSQAPFLQRTIIVGAGRAGRTVARAIHSSGEGVYKVVGFVDDAFEKLGQSVTIGEQLLPILGTRSHLKMLVQQYNVNVVVVAITHDIDAELLQILLDCLEMGVEIVPMPVLYERLTGRVPIQHVGENWYVSMPIYHPLTRPLNQLLKRLSDIVLASLGLAVLAILFPFIALAIYIDFPGPIFYTQMRVGRGGRIFRMYKFRSMIPNAEDTEAVWAQENDPRVTRVGRILRKTHIDEFPQFLNILKGEMSAVGPRPERPKFVAELTREIPFYRVRHAVNPGMAGWALVKYGYVASKEDAMVRLEYDLYYIKHWSLWFDLVILVKTVLDVLTLRGRA